MTTVAITVSGAVMNAARTFTISDADFQQLLNWAQDNWFHAVTPPPTNQQILLAWLNAFMAQTAHSVQRFSTTQVIPPPIGIS